MGSSWQKFLKELPPRTGLKRTMRSQPNSKPAGDRPEVWLLSAYHTASHASWANWLMESQPQIKWQFFELPGSKFPWRIRSNPLSWLNELPGSSPDLILATSMVDLATLKGLHPRLAEVPSWYYFHENQFAYPESKKLSKSVEHQMVQLYGALAADRLFFNSQFNRNSFLSGVKKLLRNKTEVDQPEISRRLKQKCELLPIPVEPISSTQTKQPGLILWNHRWEYDKVPEVFGEALLMLAKRGVPFKLALLGDRSEKSYQSLLKIREQLPENIVADEHADRSTYKKILAKAEIVVSTAIHEFQGLAMLEAAGAGARPLVPDALCYPEQYGKEYRYRPGSPDSLASKLEKWLTAGLPEPADVSYWHSRALKDEWNQIFKDLDVLDEDSDADQIT